MIARFRFLLPFRLHMRSSDQLQPVQVDVGGRVAWINPPYRVAGEGTALSDSLEPDMSPPSTNITIDDMPTFEANALEVVVHGEFDRRPEASDTELVSSVVSILKMMFARYRSLSRAFFMHPPADTGMSWRLRYLNDDGTDFDVDPILVRGRGFGVYQVESMAYMAPEIWQDLQQRHPTPPSDQLLLDAMAALPHVGAAIVLAQTAIEVRISTALDILATLNKDKVSTEFWSWITDRRNDFKKQPAVDEELREVLHAFVGKSLSDEKPLWDAFSELRTARNRFAHQGRAVANNKEVTVERATHLVTQAAAIVDWIEAFLPLEYRRAQVASPTRVMSRTKAIPA